MGYQALLFCPDERTARTVTQVLTELDFAVIACAEPFAAVKKLMGERFDAVVVDCDNEQNATLLFKSARNAANNQSSLAVAVVEGQAGVAKAFRMGANLVLTKPINVEQAKGTLRVARGLLRKGEAAKATNSVAPKPASGAPESLATSAPNIAASRPGSPVPPFAVGAPFANKPAQPRVAAAMIGSDAEPSLADSDEYSSPEAAEPFVETPVAKTGPAIKSLAPVEIEAETGALKGFSTPAGKTSANSETLAPPSTFGFAPKSSGSSAASAPAPAREAKTVTPIDEKPAPAIAEAPKLRAETADIKADADLREEAPALFSSMGEKKDSENNSAKSGSGRTRLLIGTAAMLVAAAVYLVSTQSGGSIALPGWLEAQVKIIKGAVGKAAPVPSPQPQAPSPAPPVPTSIQPAPSASPISAPVNTTKPSSAVYNPSPAEDMQSRPSPISTKSPKTSESTSIASKSAAVPDARPIMIKSNSSRTPTSDAPPPSMAAIAPAGNGGSLPDLAGSSAPPTPVLQTLGVSQGVSQGVVVKKVQPAYPSSALQMRIEGPVDLLATVSKTGNISGVKVVKGDPRLARAAAEAVKQWKYKPFLLNGDPVEMQTQITVDFKLPR